MTHHTLAIIGGGASAVLLLAQLARQNAPFSIDVYDRAGMFARGIAWNTPYHCHLLNVRCANISALADVPDDFVRWIAPQGYGADDFVPRSLYGDYLQTHFEYAKTQLSIAQIQHDVTCVLRQNDYQINGRHYDFVVQATGNCVRLRPRGIQDEWQSGSCNDAAQMVEYHDNPWTIDYPALSGHARIVLLGSGLTAVDVALALEANGYAGEILMLSRHAKLPEVHIKALVYPAFMAEIPSTALATLRLVRHQIMTANVPWQAIMDSLRPLTNTIWKRWSNKQQQRFMRHLFTFWNVHRHRMAPQIHTKISAYKASGRLTCQQARIQSILKGPILVTDQGTIKADAIINCLGYRYDERALIVSHRIGPACFGPLFETTAIPEIRSQAARLAQELCMTSQEKESLHSRKL